MTVIMTDNPGQGIVRLLINRPEARNAINAETREALLAALTDAQADDAIRAVIIGGAGGVFSAGGDLPSLAGLDEAQARSRLNHGHQLVSLLWQFPKPVVAAVERFAVGAAAGLVLLSDVIVMGRDAFFGFPFLKLGLIPDWGLLETVQRRAGWAAASRLFVTAATVKADQAAALNLADYITDDDQVMATAVEQATALSRLPLAAFARLKERLRLENAPVGLNLTWEAEAQAACIASAEFAEGYAAFREKRPPRFDQSGT